MMQNQINKKEFSAIILAAGKSERLGFPKLSLKYDEKSNFIEHIVDEYEKFGCKEIILVVNEIGFGYLNENEIHIPDIVKIEINKHPDWHRFYSMKIGAKALSKSRPTFIHNVDNPFVNIVVLKQLSNNLSTANYISPEFNKKGGHPFLLSENVIKEIAQVEENQKHLKEFLNQYSRLKIPIEDENVLVNINTIEEYKRYF